MKKKTAAVFLMILLLIAVLCASAEGQLSGYGDERGWTFVSFGKTAQDRPEEQTAIIWRVLYAKQEKVLLLSDKILSSGRMDSRVSDFPGWESSSLYTWLNGNFLNETFSADEQAALLYQEDLALISIPSREDLIAANAAEGSLISSGTVLALEEGLFVSSPGNTSPYWTRTEGSSFENAVYRVRDDGTLSELSPDAENMGIRPMILLDLQGVSVLSGTGTEESPYVLSLPKSEERAPRISPTPRPTVTPVPTETPSPAETPVPAQPTAEPESGDRLFPTEYEGIFPELTEEGFLPEGEEEFVWQDPERGLWLYASQDLRIEIQRRQDTAKKKKPKRWLEAEIFVHKGADQQGLRHFFSGKNAKSESLADELDIARENSLVFAVNGDWYYNRVQQNSKKRRMTVGVVLRQGEILYDDPGKKDVTELPTRDILALYRDGLMEAYAFNEADGQELLQKGAFETLCFGPILIRDGEITAKARKISGRQAENPRCGVGQIGPGHYLAVVVDGGTKESVGMKLEEFAALFAEKGCRTAFNLNGGVAANMMFMGETISENKSSAKNRLTNEVLGIGQSEAVH